MEEGGVVVPVSKYAESQLSLNFLNYFIWVSVTIVCWFLFGSIMLFDHDFKSFAILNKVVLAVIALIVIFRYRPWSRQRIMIHEANVKDYCDMLGFKEALSSLKSLKVTDHELVEPVLSGCREPFRVEHFASDSLRGELHGSIVLYGWLVLDGKIEANFSGTSTPSLLDLSTILFLQGESDTLRVVIPNALATKLMFTSSVERWLKRQPGYTHVYKALREFDISDENLVTPISNPQILDALDASCQKPLDTRPRVVVYGEQLQPGVALATALEVDGQRQVFLPSGFFHELANTASQYLVGVEAPRSLAAVQS